MANQCEDEYDFLQMTDGGLLGEAADELEQYRNLEHAARMLLIGYDGDCDVSSHYEVLRRCLPKEDNG